MVEPPEGARILTSQREARQRPPAGMTGGRAGRPLNVNEGTSKVYAGVGGVFHAEPPSMF